MTHGDVNREPYCCTTAVLCSSTGGQRPSSTIGKGLLTCVEPRGLEPLTPCLQSRCATNCAKAPDGG